MNDPKPIDESGSAEGVGYDDTDTQILETIAIAIHQQDREWCIANHAPVSPVWSEATEAQRSRPREVVRGVLRDG